MADALDEKKRRKPAQDLAWTGLQFYFLRSEIFSSMKRAKSLSVKIFTRALVKTVSNSSFLMTSDLQVLETALATAFSTVDINNCMYLLSLVLGLGRSL